MRIEWKASVQHTQYFTLFIDQQPWRDVHKGLFKNYLMELKACRDRQELEKVFQALEQKVAQLSVLRLLAFRNYFTEDIREKLQHKGLSAAAIEHAINYCQQLGYLNDQLELQRFIDQKQRRGTGPYRIALELKAKGFAPQQVDAALKGAQADSLSALKQVVEKKLRLLKGKLDRKQKHKLIQSLQRKGFKLESIFDVLNEIENLS